MNQIKKYLPNNMQWKLFALISAVSLWVLAVNLDNPTSDRTPVPIRPLEIRNLSHLVNNNIVILNEQALRNEFVQVGVFARENVQANIIDNDIAAFIDLESIGIPEIFNTPEVVSVKVMTEINSLFPVGSHILTPNIANVTLNLDKLVTETKEINVIVIDPPSQGYGYGDMELSSDYVTITGPSTIMDNVYEVVANIDLSQVTEQTSISSQLEVLDSDGTIITNNFTILPSIININIPITRVTSVQIVPPTVIGQPAQGFEFNGISLSTLTAQIFGDATSVSQTGPINLADIDISGFTTSQSIERDLRDYVQDVDLHTNPIVTIFVDISQEILQPTNPIFTVELPLSQIQIIGYDNNVTIQEAIPILVQGENINVNEITATINIENLEVGLHYIEVMVTLPNGTLIEPAFAVVTVSQPYEVYPMLPIIEEDYNYES